MDLNLKKENINYVKSILNTSFTQEETMEMIVPDALPDILRIVDTDATVLMRSKEADTERVSVSGVVSATIIYCPDGVSGVRKMDLNIPFTSVASGAEITNNSKIAAKMSLSNIDTSMINPRKILVRTNVLIEINCYNEEEIAVSYASEVEDDSAVEILCDNFDVTAPIGVKEKTFIISDEYSLPNSNPPIGEILKTNVTLSSDDAKTVGSKLIFRGRAQVAMLYRPTSGGDISSAEFSSDFSQIMELDNPSDDKSFDIKLMLTGIYFDKSMSAQVDGRTVTAELHIVAQCVASAKMNIQYISDTYSTRYELESASENLKFISNDNDLSVKEMVRETLDTPTNVRSVVSVNVHAGNVSQSNEGGRLNLKTPLNISAVYTAEDGRLLSASKKFEVKSGIEAKPGSNYSASVSSGREVYATPSGEGIDVRLPVDFHVTQTSQKNVNAISKISYNDEAPLDMSNRPSLIVHRIQNSDTLWKLAKIYNSTPDLIEEANSITDANHLSIGQLLIIPKRR